MNIMQTDTGCPNIERMSDVKMYELFGQPVKEIMDAYIEGIKDPEYAMIKRRKKMKDVIRGILIAAISAFIIWSLLPLIVAIMKMVLDRWKTKGGRNT